MRAHIAARLGAGAATALLLAGCGAGQDPTTAPPPADDDTTEPAPVDTGANEVSIVDLAFEPASLDVAVGDTVEWVNTGELPHTVTFADGPDSGTMETDDTFSHTFEEAGEFDYLCSIHPQMEGTVTVAE
ncbi:MAG TPA: cupredoxin family copper-binding protein [Egibacteraceae bacterium]|nr:cupredoxin family copper-binding protein [Egibacteraceae bacterium]